MSSPTSCAISNSFRSSLCKIVTTSRRKNENDDKFFVVFYCRVICKNVLGIFYESHLHTRYNHTSINVRKRTEKNVNRKIKQKRLHLLMTSFRISFSFFVFLSGFSQQKAQIR